MNQTDIDRIKAYCAKATPGPLAWQKFGKEYCLTGQYGMRPIILSSDRKVGLRMRDAKYDLLIPLTPDHPDAQFIANARTDLPLLLEALEQLRKDKDRLDWLAMNPEAAEQWFNAWNKTAFNQLPPHPRRFIDALRSKEQP